MWTHTQPRKPAGSPDGGQYDRISRRSAGLTLTNEDDKWEELVAIAHAVASNTMDSSRSYFDSEDARQEYLIDMLTHANRHGGVEEISPALARKISRNATSRMYLASRAGRVHDHRNIRSVDFQAAEMFRRAAAQLEEDSGEPLTFRQREELAEQISKRWPAGSRPRQGFHEQVTHEQIQDDSFHGESRSRSHAHDWEKDPDSAYNRLLDTSSGNARRRLAFNALAEVRGIPPQPIDSLSRRQADHVRRLIPDRAAIMRAISDWDRGVSSQTCEAFFRPFGASEPDHRDQIADLVSSMPEKAEEIFGFALAGATRRSGAATYRRDERYQYPEEAGKDQR